MRLFSGKMETNHSHQRSSKNKWRGDTINSRRPCDIICDVRQCNSTCPTDEETPCSRDIESIAAAVLPIKHRLQTNCWLQVKATSARCIKIGTRKRKEIDVKNHGQNVPISLKHLSNFSQTWHKAFFIFAQITGQNFFKIYMIKNLKVVTLSTF